MGDRAWDKGWGEGPCGDGPSNDGPSNDRLWSGEQRDRLATLADIQPDLSTMVDDRRQRHRFWLWTRRLTQAAVEFLKWAAMVGAAIGILKAGLQGWLR